MLIITIFAFLFSSRIPKLYLKRTHQPKKRVDIIGYEYWKVVKTHVSSTVIIEPALSNSPQ